ncbi:TIGR03032 family protein [Roseibium sp. SCP14]|uniref:TIGR03032 family protein n=1 Tax=Roseibium sp. SCP14 TaxID=3141375 RepID=UPI00333B597E
MLHNSDRQHADEQETAIEGSVSTETQNEAVEDKRQPGDQDNGAERKGADAARPAETISYSASPGLAARLDKLKISFGFTSYQSNLLYLVGRNGQGGINIHQSVMAKPMGICPDRQGGLVLTGGYQVLRFQNVLEPDQRANNLFDACYVPRTIHVTGRLDAHDVGVDDQGRVIFVNTRYNCLATTSDRHSFEPLWRPPFVSALIDEDRCHLNGLAMEDGKPRYVTAVSASDTIDGWRDRRADGGIVMDVQSGEIICRGLSMPHSPRVHAGELWVLNSGTGELGVIRCEGSGEGTFEPRVFCPGFLRGLAFQGNFAFVGLSKPRYKRFEGLALDQRLKEADSEPWCGIQIIDLSSGACVDWLRIDGNLAELYDLEVLPGVEAPMAVSPGSHEAASTITIAR